MLKQINSNTNPSIFNVDTSGLEENGRKIKWTVRDLRKVAGSAHVAGISLNLDLDSFMWLSRSCAVRKYACYRYFFKSVRGLDRVTYTKLRRCVVRMLSVFLQIWTSGQSHQLEETWRNRETIGNLVSREKGSSKLKCWEVEISLEAAECIVFSYQFIIKI